MRTFFVATSCFVAVSLLAGSVWAAPALDIRTVNNGGSVFPLMMPAGPSMIDPFANQGQWFIDLDGDFEVRTHEFYDNVQEDGGGGADYLAIQGQLMNVYDDTGARWTPGAPIAAFDIRATITNDLPGNPDMALWGTNSHEEIVVRPMPVMERTTMYDVKLTAEFAVDPGIGPPPPHVGYPPYQIQDKYIVAQNHDQLGWYCYADEVSPDLLGNFSVPTWDFGDIKPGESAQQVMKFVVKDPTGNPDVLLPGDPGYVLFEDPSEDVLLNRTTSLKISTWVDELQADWGAVPYPQEPRRGSNCSVFFNVPEPGTFVLLLGLCLSFWMLRRQS